MTEEQPYDVLKRLPDFEIRRYPPHVVAELEVEAAFEDAGDRAFRILADYIFGGNRPGTRIGMTSPAIQQSAGERIGMTAPVLQSEGRGAGRHVVSFVMPARSTLAALPAPLDERVRLRYVPDEVAAARRFGGRWREAAFAEELARLVAAVRDEGLTVTGPARTARFDPPWKPGFLRRNEVLVPVDGWGTAPSAWT